MLYLNSPLQKIKQRSPRLPTRKSNQRSLPSNRGHLHHIPLPAHRGVVDVLSDDDESPGALRRPHVRTMRNVFKLRQFVTCLLLFRLPSGFTPFRVSGSVCSFEGSGLLILMFRSGYTLFSLLLCSSVLLFGFRSRFTPFRASACVYSCLGFRAPFIPSPNWDVVF